MIQFQARLGNPTHPAYGSRNVLFPIPEDEYDRVLERLDMLGAGDAVPLEELLQGDPVEQMEHGLGGMT